MTQQSLFAKGEWWEDEWEGMPEYSATNIQSLDKIVVHFKDKESRREFLLLLGEHPARRQSIWYPKQDGLKQSETVSGPIVVPPNRYPIYVISKGRWDTRLTAKALEKLGLPYSIVIEPQEYDQYAEHIAAEHILTLPFSDLGQGSIPARNWVWEHSMLAGAKRHWILDDNMDGFYQLNGNLKRKVVRDNPFVDCETFSDRYSNVAISGLNYEFFAPRRIKNPPYRLNTRVYSCILIQNDIPFRWRGRYNEDTDLCLRALKAGWCTILFNMWLCKKMPTLTMDGGNTDKLYEGEGRLTMAESLRDQHPDVTTVSRKWGRWQHHVDYTPFAANKPQRIDPEPT